MPVSIGFVNGLINCIINGVKLLYAFPFFNKQIIIRIFVSNTEVDVDGALFCLVLLIPFKTVLVVFDSDHS